MERYRLEIVETKQQIKEFHDLAKRLYRGNRYWVCPLKMDIEAIFDPQKNALFAEGEAIRWILRDEKEVVVGRIAAFYNRETAAANEQPTGGCGFFEAINDQQVANILFDASKEWLQERGMEAMDGPINFGERDDWWGALAEGYELQPVHCSNYNPPYYLELFENYGFKDYFNQHTYLRYIRTGELNKSVYERVKRLEETTGYRFEHVDKNRLEQAADDFCLIYNRAWAAFTGVKPIEREKAHQIMNSIRPIMDEKLMYFAYFYDEPIGFFLMVPDLNRVIGRFNGHMNWLNALRLVAMLKFTKKANRAKAIIFGVVPEFHGKGVEAGMMYEFEKQVAKGGIHYKTLEICWIGDFNPVMMRVVENYVYAQKYKRHITYRYLFDREKPFTRSPRMGVKRGA